MLTPTLKTICEDPQASRIMLVISAEDLREFAHSIVQDTIKALKDLSEPKYFSRKELLEHLHISSRTLWSLEDQGIITAEKVGSKKLYNKTIIQKLIDEKKLKIRK